MIMPALTLELGITRDWRNRFAGPSRPISWLSGHREHSLTAPPASGGARRAPEFDDAVWIALVLEGDEEAAGTLVERLYPTIIKSVRCHLPRRTSEEDLVQAVFAKVFSKLNQFSGLVPLEHWVSRIAINTCINQFKHEAVRPELRMSDLSEEEEAVVQHLASTHAELPGDKSKAAREVVEKLIARLKPEERLVVTLLHLEEKSVEEISQLTGWSHSAVKVKAFRARHKMHKLWRTLFDDEAR
jgi:RNA polymerase sigma-70 factor (ECF subfamily)